MIHYYIYAYELFACKNTENNVYIDILDFIIPMTDHPNK